MKIASNTARLTRIFIVTFILATAAGLALYYYFRYEPSWEEIKTMVQDAPAWIFFATLALLPPFGMPLSIFLFAVGARFGILGGATAACIAIVVHHLIAAGMSSLITDDSSSSNVQSSIWEKLVRKSGGNSSKLLLLWGLLPGLPYVVKLYLPLTMGVKRLPYIQWNTLGHLIGAVLFVSVGSAIFSGISIPIVIAIAVALIISIALKIYRKRLKQSPA